MITRRNLFKTLFGGLATLFVASGVKSKPEPANITDDSDENNNVRYCDTVGTACGCYYIYYSDGSVDYVNDNGIIDYVDIGRYQSDVKIGKPVFCGEQE